MKALERARADLARGEPWLARDRLLGTLRDRPVDQDVLHALAETYAELGDLPAAGACWLLTDRTDTDPTAAAALTALRNRYRNAVALVHVLPTKGRTLDYPEAARRRILDVRAELAERGWDWTPPGRPTPPPGSRSAPRRHGEDVLVASVIVFWAAFVAGNLAIYVLGLVALLRWIW